MNPPQVLPLLRYFVLWNLICDVYFGHYDYQLSLTYLPLPWKFEECFNSGMRECDVLLICLLGPTNLQFTPSYV
jgi:hypothetical protein